MWVKAKFLLGDESNPKQIGYVDNRRIYEGDVFEVKDGTFPLIHKKTGKPITARRLDENGKPVRGPDGKFIEDPIMATEFSERWMTPLEGEELDRVMAEEGQKKEPVAPPKSRKVRNIDQQVI